MSLPSTVVIPEQLNMAEYFLDRRIEEGLGERVALRLPGGTMSYGEVQALANRFGNVLRSLGVRPEERVLIALSDSSEFVGAFFGTLKIGAVVVMVNPDFGVDSVRGLLEYTGASYAVVDASVAPTFEEAMVLSAGHRLGGLLVVGGDPGQGRSWESLALDAAPELDNFPSHRDDAAVWLFSGGTTGAPKAVVQTHRSFVNTTELYAQRTLAYGPEDITLSVPKLYFGYATGSNLLFPFSVGASTVLFPEPCGAEILFRLIQQHRATILINVPTMIQRMVDHPEVQSQDLSSLRLATSAGEGLPRSLHERWDAMFGVDLLDGLGTAEMWHVFLTNRPGDIRRGTLGREVEGFEVAVRDAAGQDCGQGEVGRLWVRGASRALGYWRNADKTAESFVGEWFVGGDLVSMDDEGYVTYCGRGDDAMKVAGRWCLPAEVEGVLMEHDGVEECAVVGVSNASGLTKPVAFVIVSSSPADSEMEEQLKAFVLERLAPYKHPRRVIFLEDFPRTHLGKVDRGKLKVLAAETWEPAS
ncbi:MAG: benzoate-CoA ligase family protein [Thermoanaerobaculia bacterium]|nr:benzoate-CoA ligase family protein [Thermoanaerobaculia bacterium]